MELCWLAVADQRHSELLRRSSLKRWKFCTASDPTLSLLPSIRIVILWIVPVLCFTLEGRAFAVFAKNQQPVFSATSAIMVTTDFSGQTRLTIDNKMPQYN